MRRTIVRTAAAAAVLTGLAASAAGTALAGARAPAAHHPVATAVTAAGAGQTVLTLPAAGRAVARWASDGTGSVTLLTAARSRRPASLTTLRLGRQDYAIPQAALPYLGRGLDLSLFNLRALEHDEHDGRVPVTLHYHGRLPAVPGITVTGAGRGTATGYLTAGSAGRLGTGLASLADRGLSVGLAGSGATPAPRPGAAAHAVRVTVTGTGLGGKPTSEGAVQLGNVTNGDMSMKAFARGTAAFSEPPGTYWALAVFTTPYGAARPWLRVVVLPQIKVTGNTTVRMSAATATSKIAFTTPRPASTQSSGITVVRVSRRADDSLGEEGFGIPVYVSPVTRRPLDGILRAFTYGQLLSPPGARVPYTYGLDYASPPGIIAPQHFAATPASLATVRVRFYQDMPSTAAWWTYGGTRYEVYHSLFGSLAIILRLPARRVQYLSGGGSRIWTSLYLEHPEALPAQPGGQSDTYRLVHAGQHLTQDWGEYPLHPAGAVNIPGNYYWVVPSAIRQGNVISLGMAPFSDNQPGHQGSGNGAYELLQNGKLIARGGTARTGGIVRARVSSRPSNMVFVLRASRAGARYHLSATSLDEWTWRTRPEPGARIPAPWYCHYSGLSRRCAVQPLMTFDYAVAGIGMTGTAPAGRQSITVTARHLQLAADPAITAASARFSLNNGRSWHRAGIRALGHDRFRLTFAAPRSAGITLRVTARDAAGGGLTETILRAYQTAA